MGGRERDYKPTQKEIAMKVINGIKMFSTAELQELLGVSSRTISIMRTNGVLPYTRIGRGLYTSEEALAEYLNGNTTEIKRRKRKEEEI
jgi:excisionase family DNA binding protein